MNTYNKINESEYTNKVISHVETDPLANRIELKKTYSLSTDEYFDLLDYEVDLINSLQGEILDTSDPKWVGTGNYEFTFEIDRAYIIGNTPQDDYTLFKGDIIDIDVSVNINGTVFLFDQLGDDDPGRDWSIGEAVSDDNIGYIVNSEIIDIIYSILGQRLPILKNFGTLDVSDIVEHYVDNLSNEDKGKINEDVYGVGDNEDFLDKVANMMYEESKKMGKNSFPYDSTQTSFRSYVADVYGLGYGEAEYVFRKFRFLMGWDNYDTTKEIESTPIENKNNINEGVYTSGGNKNLLDYTYNDLVENTKWRDNSYSNIDIYNGQCKNIQVMIRWGSVAPYFIGIPKCLDKLLRDIYGLNYKEIRELFWGRYDEHIISMVLSKKEYLAPHLRRLGLDYLNESVDNKFLDKVVNNLISETKPTSEKHVSVITPFISFHGMDGHWVLTAHRCREIAITNPENYMIPEIISNHLRDVYSLRSIEEMDYVLDKYYFNIYNKYFRKFFDNKWGKISESEDLEYNKEKWGKETQLFVKIVNQIMRETVTDYKNNVIKFPFDSELVMGPLFFSDINNILDSNINNLSGEFPHNFYRHCKDVYGLKYNEIKRLWSLYSAELLKHILKVWDKEWVDYQISDQGTMGTLLPESTKSVGDNSEFLNKMIDYLVDTTELIEVPHHPNIRIKYPFVDYSSNNKIPHMWYEAVPKVIFIVGMMENYGVNGEEAHFVLDRYKEKLRDKVNTKLPNE